MRYDVTKEADVSLIVGDHLAAESHKLFEKRVFGAHEVVSPTVSKLVFFDGFDAAAPTIAEYEITVRRVK